MACPPGHERDARPLRNVTTALGYPAAMPLRRFLAPACSLALAGTLGCVPHSTRAPPAVRAAPPASVAAAAPAPPPARSPATDSSSDLAAAARDADPAVIRLALDAQRCAIVRGEAAPGGRLAVIDYSRPSTQRRLWVFDLARRTLLFSEYVAHGRNTGDDMATRFSNAEGSLQSSLGLFRTAETYQGENGYSLRMDGLEPGINDRARPRAIVMHGAWYVDPLQALRQGRLGRSLGCPALRPQVARQVIDALKQGQVLFAYYPDAAWLSRSGYVGCRGHEPSLASRASLHAAAP